MIKILQLAKLPGAVSKLVRSIGQSRALAVLYKIVALEQGGDLAGVGNGEKKLMELITFCTESLQLNDNQRQTVEGFASLIVLIFNLVGLFKK